MNNLFRNLTLSLLVLAAVPAISANATRGATVNFMGQIVAGFGTGALGSIPFPDPVRNFSVSLDFSESTGSISAGFLDIAGIDRFDIDAGGVLFINGSGPFDNATVFANFTGTGGSAGTTGSLTTSINSNNVITNDNPTMANFNALLSNSTSSSTQISLGGASSGTYNTGAVAAVPEPGSGLICGGVLLIGFVRRRRTTRLRK